MACNTLTITPTTLPPSPPLTIPTEFLIAGSIALIIGIAYFGFNRGK